MSEMFKDCNMELQTDFKAVLYLTKGQLGNMTEIAIATTKSIFLERSSQFLTIYSILNLFCRTFYTWVAKASNNHL